MRLRLCVSQPIVTNKVIIINDPVLPNPAIKLDNYDMRSFSDSIANSGDRDCSRITWQNACNAILLGYQSGDKTQQIVTSTKVRNHLLVYFLGFGAWERDELRSMSNIELSALALQYIAGSYNECDSIDTDESIFYSYQGDIWTILSE